MKGRLHSRERNHAFFGRLPLLVPLSAIAVFGVLPCLLIIVQSFALWNDYGRIVAWGSFDGYATILQGHRLVVLTRILKRSFLVAGVDLLVAIPIAYALTRVISGRRRLIYLALLTIPFCTSDITRAFAWRMILGTPGLVNKALIACGILSNPVSWLMFSEFGVVLAIVAATLPFGIFPILTVGVNIPQTVWLASEDLGATRFREFWVVAVPLLLPGIITGGIASFVVAAASASEIVMLGGTSQSSLARVVQELESASKLDAIFALGSLMLGISAMAIFVSLMYSRGLQRRNV